jgi:hypothetical protein
MYTGEWKNGLPHGKGVYLMGGGLRVEGEEEMMRMRDDENDS